MASAMTGFVQRSNGERTHPAPPVDGRVEFCHEAGGGEPRKPGRLFVRPIWSSADPPGIEQVTPT